MVSQPDHCFNSKANARLPSFSKRYEEITPKLFVKIKTPNRIKIIPASLFNKTECLFSLLNIGQNFSNPKPTKINGVPNPSANEKRNSKPANWLFCEATQKRITARTGPIHGVQAKPKVTPRANAPISFAFTRKEKVRLRIAIFTNFPMERPKTIKKIPAILLSIGL